MPKRTQRLAALAVATAVSLVGLRPTPEVEAQGLDIAEHGEEGYLLD